MITDAAEHAIDALVYQAGIVAKSLRTAANYVEAADVETVAEIYRAQADGLALAVSQVKSREEARRELRRRRETP